MHPKWLSQKELHSLPPHLKVGSATKARAGRGGMASNTWSTHGVTKREDDEGNLAKNRWGTRHIHVNYFRRNAEVTWMRIHSGVTNHNMSQVRSNIPAMASLKRQAVYTMRVLFHSLTLQTQTFVVAPTAFGKFLWFYMWHTCGREDESILSNELDELLHHNAYFLNGMYYGTLHSIHIVRTNYNKDNTVVQL